MCFFPVFILFLLFYSRVFFIYFLSLFRARSIPQGRQKCNTRVNIAKINLREKSSKSALLTVFIYILYSYCMKSYKKTLAYFIKRAQRTHGNRYDYSQTDYKNTTTKVKIICRLHGAFYQAPLSHFNIKSSSIYLTAFKMRLRPLLVRLRGF